MTVIEYVQSVLEVVVARDEWRRDVHRAVMEGVYAVPYMQRFHTGDPLDWVRLSSMVMSLFHKNYPSDTDSREQIGRIFMDGLTKYNDYALLHNAIRNGSMDMDIHDDIQSILEQHTRSRLSVTRFDYL